MRSKYFYQPYIINSIISLLPPIYQNLFSDFPQYFQQLHWSHHNWRGLQWPPQPLELLQS
nr:unnamed protein product [Callosobruchus analis]